MKMKITGNKKSYGWRIELFDNEGNLIADIANIVTHFSMKTSEPDPIIKLTFLAGIVEVDYVGDREKC